MFTKYGSPNLAGCNCLFGGKLTIKHKPNARNAFDMTLLNGSTPHVVEKAYSAVMLQTCLKS